MWRAAQPQDDDNQAQTERTAKPQRYPRTKRGVVHRLLHSRVIRESRSSLGETGRFWIACRAGQGRKPLIAAYQTPAMRR